MKDGIRRIWRRGNVAFFSLVLGGLLVLLGWWIGWSAGNSAVVSSTHPAVATSPPSTLPSSLDWTRDLLSIVLSWPVVVLLILGSLMVSGAAAHRMSRVLSGFRSVKLPGGIEVVLSEEGAKEAARTSRETFEGYRAEAVAEFDRLARVHNIRNKVEGVLRSERVRGVTNVDDLPGFRCTVHVPDAVFADTLYQLIDYYPRGGGAGRVWSIRYGIMGRAWRLDETQIEASVPSEELQLIERWGMTREEAAAAGQGRQSFAAIVLKDEERNSVGLFYMDAKDEMVFGSTRPRRARLETAVREASREYGLTSALSATRFSLLRRSPFIQLHE